MDFNSKLVTGVLLFHHHLYVQSYSLFLADVFENLRNMCLEIYELDLAKNFLAPLLAWQADLKETKAKLL